MAGAFTKTLASSSAEALTTTPVFAEIETFFQAPETNVGTMTIRDENNQIRMELTAGLRDRIPVNRGAVFNPVTGQGDFHGLASWTAQGTAGDKVYIDAR